MWCMLYHLPSWVCCVSFGCISTEPYVLLSLQEVPSMKLGGTPLSSKKTDSTLFHVGRFPPHFALELYK